METVVVASGTVSTASVVARRLAAEGANVALVGIGKHGLEAVVGELAGLGRGAVLAVPCDVTELSEIAAAAARVEAELGPIDRWINLAMTDYGYVCCTRAAVDCMRIRDRGTIVQVGAPKPVRMFTQGLRGELRLAGSHIVIETVRTHPYRRLGAAAMAGAAVVGAALLRRAVRSR